MCSINICTSVCIMACHAVLSTFTAILSIMISQFQVICSLFCFIFISFGYSLVALTDFFKPKSSLVGFVIMLRNQFILTDRKCPFFMKYGGSQVKLYIIWKMHFLSTKHTNISRSYSSFSRCKINSFVLICGKRLTLTLSIAYFHYIFIH